MTREITVRWDAHVGQRFGPDAFASSVGKPIPLRWGPRPSLADFDATPLAPGEAVPPPQIREGTATLVAADVVEDGAAVLLTLTVPEEVTAIMPDGILRHLSVGP